MSRDPHRRLLLSRATWYGIGIGLFSAASIWIVLGLLWFV